MVRVIVSLTMRASFLSYWEVQGMKEKNEDPPCCGYKGERWQPVHHQRYFVILGDGSIRGFDGLARLLTTQRGNSATASKRAEPRNVHERLSGKCWGFFILNAEGSM